MVQVELVWNREFNYVPYGNPWEDKHDAVKAARAIESSGDGGRVKKTRVVSLETGKVIWEHGRWVGRGEVQGHTHDTP